MVLLRRIRDVDSRRSRGTQREVGVPEEFAPQHHHVNESGGNDLLRLVRLVDQPDGGRRDPCRGPDHGGEQYLVAGPYRDVGLATFWVSSRLRPPSTQSVGEKRTTTGTPSSTAARTTSMVSSSARARLASVPP